MADAGCKIYAMKTCQVWVCQLIHIRKKKMHDPSKLNEIREARDQWEETTLQKSLARAPERANKFITTSSEEIKRLYTPDDIADMDYARDLNDAGQYPFTRGIHATMYRGK